MHLLGSLILQSILRLPNDFILQYISSITSLEDNHVLEASKDPSGARVIEAFLSSNASTKHKRKLVIKHYANLESSDVPKIIQKIIEEFHVRWLAKVSIDPV
ncbi:Pumilio23 [Abeliophyllum distichum]|uniref:Pumilio23 n=1 Tax=Abeliophyllum distichum TaxID=126358 RepID=A0ABD1SZ54_9LAMI